MARGPSNERPAPRDPAPSTEALLEASEARYRALFDHAQVGIVLADARSFYIDANESACRMLGYTRDELVGLHASDIVVESETPHIETALAEIHGSADHQREWQFRRKDGSVFPAEVVATRMPDGTLLGTIRDLSDRRLADDYRETLAAIVESSNDAIIARNMNSIVTSWNHGAQEIFGYTPREMIGTSITRIIPGDRLWEEDSILLRVGRGVGVGHFETQRRAKDGRLVEVSLTATPLKDATGKVIGVANIARDIGALKAEEEARREAERVVRNEKLFNDQLIESMPGALYFYDADGGFLRWNHNFETVTGYTAEEISRMHPRDFFSDDERALVESRIAETFERGGSAVEADFIAKDGSSRRYFFTGQRVLFNGQPCLVGVGIDISERKQAEARVRESEAHLVEAQRIARLGSWVLDVAADQLTWSEQVYDMFGVPRDTHRSSYEAFLSFVHPEDRPTVHAALEAARAGRTKLDIEHRIVLPDGTQKFVHELADWRTDDSGAVTSLAGTVHDITDRRRIEAEREMRHRAEAADRIKSAFLATMSHELRTPLNSIIGFTGILLKGLAGPMNDEQLRQLGMVQGSARHLLALINDVLDISKIEAGQLDVRAERFDLRQSIERVTASVQPLAAKKGLELVTEVAKEVGEVTSDQRRVEQILLNLLNNAIKFTEQGRVTLSVDLLTDFRRTPESRVCEAARFCVADTGIGIKPHDLELLFQPFRQLDTGLTRHHEGTGLGLAICRRLAGLLGGEISARSEWQQGCKFTVVLPVGRAL
jgi:PAS domain S-box-containing protein